MKKIFRTIVSNPFFAGSLVMVVGSNLYNAGQFIYHIIAAQILGKAFYGDLAALINILGIFALVQISIGLTIVKFVASEKKENRIRGLVRWAIKWSFFLGLLVAAGIVLGGTYISSFLNLTQPYSVYFLAPIILMYAVASITRSVAQGLLKFSWFVVSLFAEVGVKLLLMILFVLLGYMVAGAMAALLIGVFCSLLVGIYPLKKYIFEGKEEKPNINPLIKYSLPAFLQGVALTSMYSTDLFLVKHFFAPEQAGLYAGLAKLGSIVFFATSPITHVMFPLVARKYAHGEAYHKIFYLSLLLISVLAALVVFVYSLIPQIFLSVLGQSFLEGSDILWWFGLFMGLLVIAMLFIQFYFSVGKIFVAGLFLAGAALQAVLIWFFHSTLVTVIQMSIVSAALLVLSLLIYFPYHDKKNG